MENVEDRGSHIDQLMNDMGMSSDPEVTDTEGNVEPENDTADKQKDLSVSTEEVEQTDDVNTDDTTQKDSLQSQIDGMEKRLKDKDDFINELRDQVKAKETKDDDDTIDTEEDEGFWDKPEETIKQMQEQIRIQNLQYQEVIFANGVDDYFKTVNGEDLREAVSNDSEFAKEFNGSQEPYKVAYEYLTSKNTKSKESSDAARAKMKAELLEEIRAEGGKKAPSGINNIGSSNNSGNSSADDDGFAAVFN